jgi:TolB-like protein
MSFFDELKRRNVVRVGLAYAVIGWVLAQIAEFAFENFGAPEWVLKSFVVALLLGLPVALILAWAFEMTPEGIKREKDVDRSQSITRTTGRKLDRLIIAVLGVAVIVLGINQFIGGDAQPGANTEISEADQSIAVLPFVDLSPGQSDEYFGKGIAEELLNALAQFPNLQVAARTSAFSFAGQDIDLREVGETLNVAHVLEGSIRRSGDRLRITAQLIRASDGFHLWSQTYERAMTDIFEIQDDIVSELVSILQIRLGVGSGSGRVRSHNVDTEAYETYLQGLHLWANRHSNNNRQMAIRTLRLATEIDPDFADALAAYALSLIHSPVNQAEMDALKRNDAIFDALDRALEIDPDAARAHAGLALYYGHIDFNLEKSLYHAERAKQLAPNAASAQYASTGAALARGDFETARIDMQRTRRLDPLNRVIERVEFQHQMVMGNIGEARRYLDSCENSTCEGEGAFELQSFHFEWLTGEREAALARLGAMIDRTSQGDPKFNFISQSPTSFLNDLVLFYQVMTGDADTVDPSQEVGTSISSEVLALAALIELGNYERAVEVLERGNKEHGAYAFGFLQFSLSPGGFEFAEGFRKYPGYREFWSQPGLAELAATRIANGQTAGLPLNEDGSLVEF